MNRLGRDQIKFLSFPDAEVLRFSLDTERRYLSVSCDHAHLGSEDPENRGMMLEDVILTIEDFKSFKLMEFNNEKHREILLYDYIFDLREICEFKVSDRVIELHGFSKGRGYWAEFSIFGGTPNVSYSVAKTMEQWRNS